MNPSNTPPVCAAILWPVCAVYSLATQVSKPTTGVHMGKGRGSYGLQNHWVDEFRNGFASKELLYVCG